LGGLGFFFFFTKRFMRKDSGRTHDKMIRVLANQVMGIKKSISLVQVPGAILVIGISGDSIRLLSQIEDKDILDRIQKEATGFIAPSFSDQLNKITSRFLAPKNRE
jgi:flagellar biogenesis protein FliO